MQILKTGQRLTLPAPNVQLQLSGAASAAVIVTLSSAGRALTVDLADSPLGDLLRVPQAGQIALDLAALPDTIQMVSVFHPSGLPGEILLTSGNEQYGYESEAVQAGSQVRLVEFYRRGREWKVYASGEDAGSLSKVDSSLPTLVSMAQARAQAMKAAPPAPATVGTLTLNKTAAQAKLLTLAKDQAPAMVPVIEQARLTLQKAGLDTLTFEVVLVLDVSASMTGLFTTGQVQRLVERSLAVAARLDDNGEVPVTLFGIRARNGGTVDLSNINRFVTSMRFEYDGGTLYAPAIRQVINDASEASWPTLVLFITDGENSDHREAEAAMIAASTQPVFFKFLALGNGPFRFLEKLDTMPGRTVDNANFAQIENLARTGDAELFDLISQEISDWMPAARKAGILTADGRPTRNIPVPKNPGPPSDPPKGKLTIGKIVLGLLDIFT